jgi:hypothetical protein
MLSLRQNTTADNLPLAAFEAFKREKAADMSCSAPDIHANEFASGIPAVDSAI